MSSTPLGEFIDRRALRWPGLTFRKAGGKEGKQCKELIDAVGQEEFSARLERYLAERDHRVVETHHCFEFFRARFDNYARAEPVEHEREERPTGTRTRESEFASLAEISAIVKPQWQDTPQRKAIYDRVHAANLARLEEEWPV